MNQSAQQEMNEGNLEKNDFPQTKAQKRAQFLEALAFGASVTRACEEAHLVRSTVYRWREKEERFRENWQEAFEKGTDRLEDRAYELAETISERMLVFLLKARRPEVYGDRHVMETSNILYHISDQPLTEEEFEATLDEEPLELPQKRG